MVFIKIAFQDLKIRSESIHSDEYVFVDQNKDKRKEYIGVRVCQCQKMKEDERTLVIQMKL
jgi:predicted ribosome-associated RNA-binding protein Tma20